MVDENLSSVHQFQDVTRVGNTYRQFLSRYRKAVHASAKGSAIVLFKSRRRLLCSMRCLDSSDVTYFCVSGFRVVGRKHSEVTWLMNGRKS